MPGLVGKYIIETLARLPVEVDTSSEFRYRNPIIDKHTLVLAVSQSGETADTLAAAREARAKGAKVIAICNVVGSSLAREADGILYTYAGQEIGVASTKAYSAQLMMFYLLALKLAQVRKTLPPKEVKRFDPPVAAHPVGVQRNSKRHAPYPKNSGSQFAFRLFSFFRQACQLSFGLGRGA